MKKIVKFLSLLLVMLLSVSQMAWADAYYAKAKVEVSSKSSGMGTVYIGPAVQFASADEATSFDGTQSKTGYVPFEWDNEGLPNPTTSSMEDLFHWFAPADIEAIVYRGQLNLTDAGMARPVYAAYMAVPNPGYYLKGWSLVNNDVALGNVNPFAYPVMSQAMSTSAEVKEVQVYVPGSEALGVDGPLSMDMYVAEGKSNRYMVADGPYCVRHDGPWDMEKSEWSCSKEVFRCPKVDGQYVLYDMDPTDGVMHLYIPHFDNVTRHVYVLDDNGEKVEIMDKDGSYLTFPKDADGKTIVGATYIIYKNPYYKQAGNPLCSYEFLPHRYNADNLAAALNLENYPYQNYMYDLEGVSEEEIEAIVTQRIQEAVMTNVQNALLNPDFGDESALLLVNFKTAEVLNGWENDKPIYAPAAAYSSDDDSNPISFLPSQEELPSVPTMYATFAPVQINGCTGGNIVNWSEVTDNTFNVTFSTSYASSTADFGAVTFDKQPDGGTYSAVVTDYNDNEVTIAVTFTPAGELSDGEYKASMTLPSLGGESYVSCLVNVRVGEEANKAVAIGDDKYDNLASALAAANAGDELVVLTNLTEDATINKNITLNLDNWTLNGDVTVNGNVTIKNGTLSGDLTNAGRLIYDNVTLNGTLTNNGTANLKRGVLNGQDAVAVMTSGMITLEKGVEVISNVCGVYMTAGMGTVNGAKFYGSAPFKIEGGEGDFKAGYFTQEFATEMAAMGMTHYDVTVGPAFEAGYTHLYAKDLDAAQAAGAPVCKIGQTGYSSLEDALLYAQNNPTQEVTIIMTNDYALPAGYYTLPANASLLIPYQEDQTSIMGGHPKKLPYDENAYTTPFAFRTLTFADGVHISVAGNIEASCMQFIAGKGETGNAIPSGAYGWLRLEKGAEVTMGNGSHLYAWGFVTGEGKIDVRRGGAVHEDFQVYDWPGGGAAMDMLLNSVATGAGAFPINQYFMQNVESQTTFHPGARMYCSFGASAGGFQVAADAIQIVGIEGDIAMFLMDPNADADNTWVRKRYDIEKDIQVWEVNSGAHLGSMLIEVPLLKSLTNGALAGFDSRNFILPLTNNLKIHLLSGYMDITQNTELLPGAEIEMDKESTIEILEASDASSGFLYLIDKADWDDAFACGRPGQQILYSPSWVERGHADGKPNVRNIESKDDSDFANSKVNVHGTFQVSGFVLATPHAANIVSTNEDAGTVVFPNEVNFTTSLTGEPMLVHMPTAAIPNQLIDAMFGDGAGFPVPHCRTTQKSNGEYNNGVMQEIPARSALLHNGVDAPAESAGSTTNEIGFTDLGDGNYVPNLMIPGWEPQEGDNFTMPGESFCYMGDRWTKMKQLDERFAYDNYNEWYIKPAEYVEVASTSDVDPDSKFAGMATMPQENSDHTYSDAAGEGRLFIWVVPQLSNMDAPGQWWEVTLEDNLYKGKNGTFYEYNDADERWVEHSFEITFLNWDGKPVLDHNDEPTVYSLHYGDRIQYLGTNPTRAENVDYTYNFTGWSPALTADSKVTGDATYTATYEAIQRKYTVIFLSENGTEIERHFLTRDEMPVCENVPSKTGYYLQWTPAIGAVTGDAEYRATFTPEKPTSFMITFKNYDGTVLQSAMVNVGETPACAEPSKPATSEYTYAFADWNPAIEPVSQEMTYTAKFDTIPMTYAIRFFDEKDVQIGETQNLAYGVAPAIPDYVKPADAEYTYTTTWKPVDAETGNVTAVTGNQDYKAVITPTKNKYTVTCVGEGCVFTGAGSYEYGKVVTLTLAAQTNYENAQWSDESTGNKVITVTGDVTFTATATLSKEVSVPTYTIIFLKENDEEYIRMEKLANTVPSCDYVIKPEVQYLTTWTPAIQPVRRDITYKATPVLRQYTITCEGEHCTIEGAGTYDYGTEVTLTLAAADGYENAKWSDGTTGDKVITVIGDATYTASATLIPAKNIDLTDGEDDVTLTKPTQVASLNIVAGEGVTTPQLFGAEYIEMMEGAEVTFTYSFGTAEKPAEKLNWYAFAVPFKCDAQKAKAENGSSLRNTHEYDIVEYDGAVRAAQGKVPECWKPVSGLLYPGKLYMIVFNRNQTTVTFTGKDNLTYFYDNAVSVEKYPLTGGDLNGNGWNGIANPALYCATLATSATHAEEYVDGGYSPVDLSDMAIAKPVFVQATASLPVVVKEPSLSSVSARRAPATNSNRYILNLGKDRVFLVNDEMAEDEYVTGQDLAKFGVSTKSAQIWVNRYNAKLCVNHQAPVYDETTYPLGIFAPKSDNYTLSQTEGNSEYEVILMHNNVPVANLSRAAYTLALQKGNTEDYSVVIRRVVGAATDMENTEAATNDVQKVLINGKLYILAGEHVYDALGQLVK